MLAKLELKLKCEKELTYQMSSLFHGALMELLRGMQIICIYSSLHPYAQHLECREGNWYWVITGLNKEAVKIIIQDTLWKLGIHSDKNMILKSFDIVKKIIWKQHIKN